MADPLSIIGSIVGMTAACVQSAKALHKLRGAYLDADLTVSAICCECTIMSASLSKIQAKLLTRSITDDGDEGNGGMAVRSTLETALTGCLVIVSVLEREIGLLCPPGLSGTGGLDWVARVKMMWKEDVMKELLGHLRGQQTGLALLLQLLDMESTSAVERAVRENTEVLQQIKARTKSIRTANPEAHPPQSIFDLDLDVQSLPSINAEDTTSTVGSTMFDFDDQLVNSTTYRRALVSLQIRASRLTLAATAQEGQSSQNFAQSANLNSTQAIHSQETKLESSSSGLQPEPEPEPVPELLLQAQRDDKDEAETETITLTPTYSHSHSNSSSSQYEEEKEEENINSRLESFKAALYRALEQGSVPEAQTIWHGDRISASLFKLDNPGNCENRLLSRGIFGGSVLHEAAATGHADLCGWLCKRGANPLERTYDRGHFLAVDVARDGDRAHSRTAKVLETWTAKLERRIDQGEKFLGVQAVDNLTSAGTGRFTGWLKVKEGLVWKWGVWYVEGEELFRVMEVIDDWGEFLAKDGEYIPSVKSHFLKNFKLSTDGREKFTLTTNEPGLKAQKLVLRASRVVEAKLWCYALRKAGVRT